MKSYSTLVAPEGSQGVVIKRHFLDVNAGKFRRQASGMTVPSQAIVEEDLENQANVDMEIVATELEMLLVKAANLNMNIRVFHGPAVDEEGNILPPSTGRFTTVGEVYPNRTYTNMAYDIKNSREAEAAEKKRITEMLGTENFYTFRGQHVPADLPVDIYIYVDSAGLPQVRVEFERNDKVIRPTVYDSTKDEAAKDLTVLNERCSVFCKAMNALHLDYEIMIFDSWPWPLKVASQKAVVGGIETFAMVGARGRCIKCDKCGDEYNGGNGSTKAGPIRTYRSGQDRELIRDAQALGWTQVKVGDEVHDICPKCNADIRRTVEYARNLDAVFDLTGVGLKRYLQCDVAQAAEDLVAKGNRESVEEVITLILTAPTVFHNAYPDFFNDVEKIAAKRVAYYQSDKNDPPIAGTAGTE